MRWMRARRSFALLALAVVVFATIVPVAASSLPAVVLAPLWLVPPAVSITVVLRSATRSDDQPLALLSLALFRAPPATLAVA